MPSDYIVISFLPIEGYQPISSNRVYHYNYGEPRRKRFVDSHFYTFSNGYGAEVLRWKSSRYYHITVLHDIKTDPRSAVRISYKRKRDTELGFSVRTDSLDVVKETLKQISEK